MKLGDLPMSQAFRAWLIRHIRLEEDPKMEALAASRVSREGIFITVGERFHDLDPADKVVVLLHEAAHVIRRDFKPLQEEGLHPMAWNLATDAVINSTLDQDAVARLQGVTYQALRGQFPALPPVRPSARAIYEVIVQQGMDNDGLANDLCGGPSWDGSQEGMDRAIEAAITADGPELAGLKAGLGAGKKVALTPAPRPDDLITALLDRLAIRVGEGSQKIRKRTYRREGRLPGSKGRLALPRASVLLVLDVSGSCLDLLPKAAAVARYLASHYDVKVAVFSDEAAYVRDWKNVPHVGGGTRVQAALDLIKGGRFDGAVIMTDGDFQDAAAPSMFSGPPVIYVIYGNHDVKVRGRDFVVRRPQW